MRPTQHTALRNLQQEAARLQDENRDLRQQVESLQGSIRTLGRLNAALSDISPETDVHTLLREILRSATEVIRASEGSLLLKDEVTDELVFAVVLSEASRPLVGFRLPPGEGIAGWVAQRRQAQVVRDVQQDRRFSPLVDQMFDFGTRSLVEVPLLDGERVLGVIELVNKLSDEVFNDDDLDLLHIAARLAALAIARAEQALEPSCGVP